MLLWQKGDAEMSDINKKTNINIKSCAMAAVLCAAIGCTGCGQITNNTVNDISNSVTDGTTVQTTTVSKSTSDTETTSITDTETSTVTTETTTDTTTSKADEITSTLDLIAANDIKKLCDANESVASRYDGVSSEGKKTGGVYFAWKNKSGQYCYLIKADDGTVNYNCDGMTAMYSDGKESYSINTTDSSYTSIPAFTLNGKDITSKATSDTDGSTKYVIESQVTQSEAKSLGGQEAGTLTETVTVGKDLSVKSFTRILSSSSGKNTTLLSAQYTYGDTMPKCSFYEEYNDNPRVSITVKFTDGTADKSYEIPKGKSFTYSCASGYTLRTSRSAKTDYECPKALNDNLTLYCVKK